MKKLVILVLTLALVATVAAPVASACGGSTFPCPGSVTTGN